MHKKLRIIKIVENSKKEPIKKLFITSNKTYKKLHTNNLGGFTIPTLSSEKITLLKEEEKEWKNLMTE